ncbi:MAG: hypothetical protein FWB98_05655, partial [Defluviitaleaceae bacterium]|nr:hypothetical protein [Defluviitaleaceae bacterium]
PIPPADVAVGGTVDAAWFDPPLAAGDPSPFNMEYEYPSGSGNFYTVNAGDPLSADAISALGAGDMTTLQAIPEGGIHAGTPDVPAGTLHAVVTYEWLNRPDRQTANWEDDPNIILTVVGQPSTPGGPGYPHGINILRLPYHAHYDANGNQVRDIQVPPFLAGLPVNVVSVNNAPNPYIPVAGSITFIRETGEFVIHSNDLPAFDTSHFTTPTNATRTLDFSNATFPIPAGTYINVAGTDVYIGGSTILSTIADAINAAGIAEIANIGTPLPPGQTHLALFSVVTGSAGNFSVTGLGPIGATQVLYPTGRDVTLAPYRGVTLTYNINGVFQNELNPIIFFDTNRADNGNVLFFSQANQELQFEMGTNTHLTINAQARDVAPWQMFADMNSLIRWVNNIYNNPDFDTNSEEAARERAFFSEQLYTKFTNTMERFDGHIQTTTTEFTALGSRMERMEMVSVRLDENEDTFRALRDQNENIDYIEILMRLNSAEAVFQAAMQIGARVNQLSLVNFI